jgi:transcriptional antiterminator Rof (Rho-off)
MSHYQPVSCDLHSQYELFAMHKTPVTIQLHGEHVPLEGMIRDIRIMDNAECLILSGNSGDEHIIPLDTIRQVTTTGDADV